MAVCVSLATEDAYFLRRIVSTFPNSALFLQK